MDENVTTKEIEKDSADSRRKTTTYALYRTWDDYGGEHLFHLAKLVTIDGHLVLPESDCNFAYGDKDWAERISQHYGIHVNAEMPLEATQTASKASEDKKVES